MADKILSLQLRPKKLSEMFGQKRLVMALRNQVAEREPQAWMFHGPSGTGKTTLARIIALSGQCPHQTAWGEPCPACWEQWAQFTIHELNASEVNKVEDMAQVAEQARYKPVPPSRKRVIILDEAQRLTSQAQNLLLKPFEDPVASTVWIICTTEPNKILATLRRRCMSYAIPPLSMGNVEVFLKRGCKKLGVAPDMAALIDAVHTAGVQAPALLLMILDKIASGATISQAVSGVSNDSMSMLGICKATTRGDWRELRGLLAKVEDSEARLLRAAVAGYLRGMLWKESNEDRQELIAASMTELLAPAPLEDHDLLLWQAPVLYRICARFAA